MNDQSYGFEPNAPVETHRVLLVAPACDTIRALARCLAERGCIVDLTHTLPVAFAYLDSRPCALVVAHRALNGIYSSGVRDTLRFAAGRQPWAILAMLAGCLDRKRRQGARGHLRLHLQQRRTNQTSSGLRLAQELQTLIRLLSEAEDEGRSGDARMAAPS